LRHHPNRTTISAVRASFNIAISVLFALCAAIAHASNKHLEVPADAEATAAAAYRYANATDAQVLAELAARRIPHERINPPPAGVRLPLRLTGPLSGVNVHSTLPPEQRQKSPFEIMDARLALALDDLCRILAQHEIVELVHFTIYRPPGGESDGSGAAQTRHPGGMAIDVGALRKKTGQWLTVKKHWSPAIGAKTCGPGARKLEQEPGRELVSLVCEAADRRVFHYMLTPHFNAAHADHLHLEIKPGVKWFLVN
jgi:hypothetical protein